MNRALTVFLCIVAVLATGLAVAAGSNISLVLPVALIAVVAAALLLAGVAARTRWPPNRPLPTLPADPALVRSSIGSGPSGRPALVLLLDQLERSEKNPARPNTTIEELERIRALRPDEFRSYLAARVDFLERDT